MRSTLVVTVTIDLPSEDVPPLRPLEAEIYNAVSALGHDVRIVLVDKVIPDVKL